MHGDTAVHGYPTRAAARGKTATWTAWSTHWKTVVHGTNGRACTPRRMVTWPSWLTHVTTDVPVTHAAVSYRMVTRTTRLTDGKTGAHRTRRCAALKQYRGDYLWSMVIKTN